MASNAARAAQHKWALTVGLSISAAAHFAVLTVVTLPAPPGEGAGPEVSRVYQDEFEAIEVVELAEAIPTSTVPVPTVWVETSRPMTQPGAPIAKASPAAAPAHRSLDDLLSGLGDAAPTVAITHEGRPVMTFRDLEPVAPSAAQMAAAAFGIGILEDDEGGWGSLLGRLGSALTGGGHCPTPGSPGPFILR